MPAHPDLIAHAESLREMRRHVLEEDDEATADTRDISAAGTADDDELPDLHPGDVTTIAHDIDDPVRQLTEIQRIASESIRSMALHGRSDELATITLIQIRQILGMATPQGFADSDANVSDGFDLGAWREQQKQQQVDEAFEELLDELRGLTGIEYRATKHLVVTGAAMKMQQLADTLDVAKVLPSKLPDLIQETDTHAVYRAALDHYIPDQQRRIVQALEQADD
jgi:hypothetical protein